MRIPILVRSWNEDIFFHSDLPSLTLATDLHENPLYVIAALALIINISRRTTKSYNYALRALCYAVAHDQSLAAQLKSQKTVSTDAI